MLYCFDTCIPKSWSYSEKEKEICKRNNNGILFNSSTDEFVDFNGNKVDITGKVIFPRTGAIQIFHMNNEILRQGGIPFLSNDEIEKIDLWPQYCSLKRKIKIFKGRDLLQSSTIDEIEKEFGEEIFIKTKEKNFSSIIPISLLRDNKCAFYKALEYHLDEEFFVSEKVDIVKDQYGYREYRIFVIDNKIYNISRISKIPHIVEPEILENANRIICEFDNGFPITYVLDLFVYSSNNELVIDINELNPVHASGLYLYNSIFEKSNDILHTDISKVSEEFKDEFENNNFGDIVENTHSNNYRHPHTFAFDLYNICMTGSKNTTLGFIDWPISVEDFSKHDRCFTTSTLIPLNNDKDFITTVSLGPTIANDTNDSNLENLKLTTDIIEDIRNNPEKYLSSDSLISIGIPIDVGQSRKRKKQKY